MMWRTHLLAGSASVWVLTPFPGIVTPANVGLLVAVAGASALLPDIDAAQSKIKHLDFLGIQPLVPLSMIVHRTFGHRGLFHSLAALSGVGAFAAGLAPYWGVSPSLALITGYASHLLLDACTKSGIPLLWPNPRRYWLLPLRLRFTTGSFAEEMLLPLLADAVAMLVLLMLPRW